MKKFKYLKISKTKKLRFIDNYYKKNLYIVFLPGFMSDIDGKKPQAFKKYAVKNKLGFLAIEYSGHGKSSGEFTKGNITEWSNDAKNSIKKIVKRNKFILIGSSMGAWISLNQFKYFKDQILGFVGIGSAPEFLERLMWRRFPKKNKNEIISKGLSIIKSGQYEYQIGKCIAFSSNFLHSTDVGKSSSPSFLLSMTFGTDRMEHWNAISKTAATQGLIYRLPNGCFGYNNFD